MDNPLKEIDFDRWYVVLLAVATIALVASIAAKERLYTGLSFGFILIGIGELINHPMRVRFNAFIKITSRRRLPSLLGNLIDAAGLILVLLFSYRLAFQP